MKNLRATTPGKRLKFVQDHVVTCTLQGELVWPSETPPVMLGLARSSELTAREFDVLHQLAHGQSYEQRASELGISLNTVKYHVKNLLAKTGFESTLALVVEFSLVD